MTDHPRQKINKETTGHKMGLSKFKNTEVISSIFSDYDAMRLEINYKKKPAKARGG